MQVDFFNKYVPEDARVHLLGHSIGAYLILQLLKVPEINSKITDTYLLFPAIERIAETPNGKFFVNFVMYIYWILIYLSYVFLYLPGFVQYILLYIYGLIMGIDKRFIPTTTHLIRPSILSKIFFMAIDEMNVVRDLDLDVINENKDKIRLYYGANDGWGPVSFCKELQRKCPDVKAEVCRRNLAHAYVLQQSEATADLVAEWFMLKT